MKGGLVIQLQPMYQAVSTTAGLVKPASIIELMSGACWSCMPITIIHAGLVLGKTKNKKKYLGLVLAMPTELLDSLRGLPR